jgi:DNA-binding XRE family transcriptional regulator
MTLRPDPDRVVQMSRPVLPDHFQLAEFRVLGSGPALRPCSTTLGQRLRDLRMARGWDQGVMAAQLGKEPNTGNAGPISSWERGKHLPDLRTLHTFARAFGLTVSELLDGVL